MSSILRSPPAFLSFASRRITPADNASVSFATNPHGLWISDMILTTIGATLLLLLILEQFNYRWKKSWLPGDKWTIPVIGKFLNSMHPTLENYQKQWDMGPLSALSVFNMCVP